MTSSTTTNTTTTPPHFGTTGNNDNEVYAEVYLTIVYALDSTSEVQRVQII